MSNKPYRILLFDDAPILSLSFHAQLGKNTPSNTAVTTEHPN
jgi:hypothetical protein